MAPRGDPGDHPNLFWMWGEIQKGFGRLEGTMLANRQATIDQGTAIRLRQDDMRRELLGYIVRMERGMEKRGNRRLSWLKWVPWDRVMVFAASSLGALGWVRPEWLRMLVGGP